MNSQGLYADGEQREIIAAQEARIRELEAERDELLGCLSELDRKCLTERFVQSDQDMQRKIVVAFAVRYEKAKAECDAARAEAAQTKQQTIDWMFHDEAWTHAFVERWLLQYQEGKVADGDCKTIMDRLIQDPQAKLRAEAAQANAAAAEMREAIAKWLEPLAGHVAQEVSPWYRGLQAALAFDAGKELLDRLEAAEKVCEHELLDSNERGEEELCRLLAAWEESKRAATSPRNAESD